MSKILIVEDEESIADLEKDYLELSGFEVEIASDGTSGLKKALEEQLFEYQNLRRKAAELLNKRGEKPSNAGTIAKMSSGIMAIGKLMIDRSDSKIAEMTIQGNNLGVNKTLRHLHDYDGEDKEVKNLTEKLLATEENNVEKLKMFL